MTNLKTMVSGSPVTSMQSTESSMGEKKPTAFEPSQAKQKGDNLLRVKGSDGSLCFELSSRGSHKAWAGAP